MFYRLTLTKILVFLLLCLPISSIKPHVPDLNLNKYLESMSPYKYFLHLNPLSTLSDMYTLIKKIIISYDLIISKRMFLLSNMMKTVQANICKLNLESN